MTTIDETLSSAVRPRTSAGRTPSLLDIGLDAIRAHPPGEDGGPPRPSTSQGFRSNDRLAPVYSPLASPNPFRRPHGEEEEIIPDAVPIHARPVVPPSYERHDPTARTYLLRSPIIFSTAGSSPQTPAYQLDAAFGKSGRPYQLRIRPLDHIESRTVSLRVGGGGEGLPPEVGYDDDHTLYLLQVVQLLGGFGVPGFGFGPSWRVEMQRDPKHGSGRTAGIIRFEGGGFLGTGTKITQKSGCKFWYMTKKSERAMAAGNEWKLIHKYGWQPEFEWNKRLMFSVEKKRNVMGKNRGFEWKDGKGRLVAIESAEGRLDMTGVAASMSAYSRESLLACWVGKAWVAGTLTW